MADLKTDPSTILGDRFPADGLYPSDANYFFLSAESADRRATEGGLRL